MYTDLVIDMCIFIKYKSGLYVYKVYTNEVVIAFDKFVASIFNCRLELVKQV